MVRRREISSFVLPESGASREMALGRSKRTRIVSPVFKSSLRARASLITTNDLSKAMGLPLRLSFQNASSTPSTCAPFTRTLPFAALAEPVAMIKGADFVLRARFSVNQRSPPSTPPCTFPRRSSATRRRLARTESPTSNDPVRIVPARKVPNSKPRCPRQ